jgi:hypothetical protein
MDADVTRELEVRRRRIAELDQDRGGGPWAHLSDVELLEAERELRADVELPARARGVRG